MLYVSDNILLIFIQEPLLILKRFIVHLHTLSAYNSLLVCYKVYSSDPRECLCTSWRYAETYQNFSIDPAPCRKNPIKKLNLSYCHPLLLGESYTEIKAWRLSLIPTSTQNYIEKQAVTTKVSLENLVWNALKKSKLWNKNI